MKCNFEDVSGDSLKTWKVLNKMFKKNASKVPENNIQLKSDDGEIVSDPLEVAIRLNHYFVIKPLKLAEKLPESNLSIF